MVQREGDVVAGTRGTHPVDAGGGGEAFPVDGAADGDRDAPELEGAGRAVFVARGDAGVDFELPIHGDVFGLGQLAEDFGGVEVEGKGRVAGRGVEDVDLEEIDVRPGELAEEFDVGGLGRGIGDGDAGVFRREDGVEGRGDFGGAVGDVEELGAGVAALELVGAAKIGGNGQGLDFVPEESV